MFVTNASGGVKFLSSKSKRRDRSPEVLAQEKQMLVLLREMISLLPDTYSQVIELRVYEGFTTRRTRQISSMSPRQMSGSGCTGLSKCSSVVWRLDCKLPRPSTQKGRLGYTRRSRSGNWTRESDCPEIRASSARSRDSLVDVATIVCPPGGAFLSPRVSKPIRFCPRSSSELTAEDDRTKSPESPSCAGK